MTQSAGFDDDDWFVVAEVDVVAEKVAVLSGRDASGGESGVARPLGGPPFAIEAAALPAECIRDEATRNAELCTACAFFWRQYTSNVAGCSARNVSRSRIAVCCAISLR